jgi:small-conductance mechanosensitive channel
MRTSAAKMITSLCLLTLSIVVFATLQAGAVQSGTVDDIAKNAGPGSTEDALPPPDTENGSLLEESAFHKFVKYGKDKLNIFGQEFFAVFSNYPAIPSEILGALNHLTGGKGPGHLAEVFLLFILMLTIGFGVEKLFSRPMNKYKQQLQATVPRSFLQLAGRLSARTLIELLSFGVFAATIVVIYLLFYPAQGPLHELAMVYLPPIFFMRLALILLNTLYSPTMPHMRISPQNCRSSAMYLMGFMAFIIISLFVTKTLWLLKSHGMSPDVFLLLYSHLGMFQFLLLLAMLWKDRTRISRSITKEKDDAPESATSFGSKLNRIWFPLALLGLIAFELLWQVNMILYQKDLVLPLLLTILSIPFGLLLFSIGNRLLMIAAGHTELMDPRVVNKDILPPDVDITEFIKVELPPEPISIADSSKQKGSLFARNLSLIRKLMGFLIACTLFFWVMNLWGLDLPLGRSIVQSATSIFVTLLIAYAVWEIFRSIIDRKLEEDRPQSADMEDMEEGSEGSRKGTLLTLLRKVIMAVIAVAVVLTTLSAVGINIGPLLAGAGILGLAVGFGSQTLVRDILSGVFFLMDDAFRVGDYIETAGTKGMVEHISLRSLRLRHPRGMVYTIPFGDMGSVQNFSRDYIITKLDVRVRYDADIEKIRKIIKKISKELQEDEETGSLLLSKIKSQGVREMDDSAMILRIKFKTKPGDQFMVRREVYRRVQERFREQGIEFAHRNVTVYLPPEVTGAAAGGGAGQGAGLDPFNAADRKLLEAGAAAAIAASQAEGTKNEPK